MTRYYLFVTVIYVSCSSDFALYIQPCLIERHHTLDTCLSLLFVELMHLVYTSICLLQRQNNYDLFNMRSLHRVWRCRQTDLVLDKGGVKISTRNRPLSP